jgi:hypothetical protein
VLYTSTLTPYYGRSKFWRGMFLLIKLLMTPHVEKHSGMIEIFVPYFGYRKTRTGHYSTVHLNASQIINGDRFQIIPADHLLQRRGLRRRRMRVAPSTRTAIATESPREETCGFQSNISRKYLQTGPCRGIRE